MVANGKLYTMIMEKLNFEPILDISNITVSIQGNHDIVLLQGIVSSFAEKFIAENAVKTIQGVRAVVNDIKVEPSIKYKRTDTQIAADATQALQFSVLVPAENIKIVVKDGNITLSGEVEWQYQRNNAEVALRNLWGVKSITNIITIKPSINIDENKVKQQITKEFERHARIDAGKVRIEIEGRKIILKGQVTSFDEMNIAEEAAWSVPGVIEVKNELTIE
jgi:osmotically-inducible protein OsmY